MLVFGWAVAIGVAASIAYVRFGGPRIPEHLRRAIDEVVASEVPELVEGRSGFARSGAIRLWYEDLAPPAPEMGTVLLLMSMGGDALMWPRAFLDHLLGEGYRVVRFDPRETGLSDRVTGWQRKDAYTVVDLAEDAVAVLDHLEIDRAHVCGLSLGGMVAQELAIRHPGRVDSLVLMSTSPDVSDVLPHEPDLLRPNHCFSVVGSRCGDKRVPASWLRQRRPKLGWCWCGNPHTWLGSALCVGRSQGVPVGRTPGVDGSL